jgi:hypothetical protein
MKENKKLKIEMIKKEEKRIKKLVMLAYESDPRIKKFEQKLEEEKRLRKEL